MKGGLAGDAETRLGDRDDDGKGFGVRAPLLGA